MDTVSFSRGDAVRAARRLEHALDPLSLRTNDFHPQEGLSTQLARLRHGDHLCSFYDTAAEQEAVACAFLREGLARGERCVYVVDDRTREEILSALGRAGVDVGRTHARDALHFITRAQWRNPGDFEVAAMAAGIKRLVRRALAPSWPGLWLAVEMTWALNPDITPERLAEWESFWNHLLEGLPAVLLCQYNRRRIPPAAVYLELKTHPLVVTPRDVHRNFYYEPPDLFRNQEAYGERVEWMLAQFRRARALEDERARRLHEQAARVQAEAARERVIRILERISDGFFALDRQGRVTYLNQRAEQLLARRRDEVLGKPVWEGGAAAGTSVLRYEQFRRAMADQVPLECEWWSPLLNAWFAVHAYPSPEGVSVYVHDISERKRHEHETAQLIAELQRSNAELQQFAYVASHDLQEPLRMVSIYVELLAARYRGQLDAEAEEFVSYAVEGAQRMKALIDDLLRYSRVGAKEPAVAPTDCALVLQQVLSDLQAAIEDSGAVVTADALPAVLADAVQLRQLLQNLLSNALKFRGDVPPRVHVSARPEGRQWVLTVRDNGIGLDPRHAERIFHVFQRLHPRQKYPGTGIGLAICKKIVERHGGRIWVESAPGQGASFCFTLPAV